MENATIADLINEIYNIIKYSINIIRYMQVIMMKKNKTQRLY